MHVCGLSDSFRSLSVLRPLGPPRPDVLARSLHAPALLAGRHRTHVCAADARSVFVCGEARLAQITARLDLVPSCERDAGTHWRHTLTDSSRVACRNASRRAGCLGSRGLYEQLKWAGCEREYAGGQTKSSAVPHVIRELYGPLCLKIS